MIVLHIAAEDARRPWHERPNPVFAVSFAEGFVLGIEISYVAFVLCIICNVNLMKIG